MAGIVPHSWTVKAEYLPGIVLILVGIVKLI